jgi:hypothetical protein
MSSIQRSESCSLFIYLFEANTPIPTAFTVNTPLSKAEESTSDEYSMRSNPNTSDTSLKNRETLGKKNTTPSIPVSSINLMDKFRKLDRCISNHKPWIIRDFFLLFNRKDIQILLNTSKSFAYCILSDPVLKEKFTLLFPRDVNFDQQKKTYPINDFYQYLLELQIVKPKYHILAVLQTTLDQLYQKWISPVKQVPTLLPPDEPDAVMDPNETVWTTSELPLGARIAPKVPFVRPISITPRQNEKTRATNHGTALNERATTTVSSSLANAKVESLNVVLPIKGNNDNRIRPSRLAKPKLKETTCTICERPSGKRIKPDYIQPLPLPQQKFTQITNEAPNGDHVKAVRRGFRGIRKLGKSSRARDPTIGHTPYHPSGSNGTHLKKAIQILRETNEDAAKKD